MYFRWCYFKWVVEIRWDDWKPTLCWSTFYSSFWRPTSLGSCSQSELRTAVGCRFSAQTAGFCHEKHPAAVQKPFEVAGDTIVESGPVGSGLVACEILDEKSSLLVSVPSAHFKCFWGDLTGGPWASLALICFGFIWRIFGDANPPYSEMLCCIHATCVQADGLVRLWDLRSPSLLKVADLPEHAGGYSSYDESQIVVSVNVPSLHLIQLVDPLYPSLSNDLPCFPW